MSERSFSFADQQEFAKLSGDYNPMHVDPIRARRLFFGQPVVHGIHLVLWALESVVEKPCRISQLKAVFDTPVAVASVVTLKIEKAEGDDKKVLVRANDATTATITFTATDNDAPEPNTSDKVCADQNFVEEECLVYEDEELATASGNLELAVHKETLQKLFPGLVKCLPADQLAVILATTRLVGMKCPGLHSIYKQLKLTFSAPETAAKPELEWSVKKYDPRFGLLDMNIAAPGVSGQIRAFVRPQPASQPLFTDLKEKIQPAAFEGQNALIVGGSRGLGELTAKILAAGGANVLLTYNLGKDDGDRVVSEITAQGGTAKSAHLDVSDVGQNDFSEALRQGESITHLYYFMTSPINVSSRGVFSKAVFDGFCNSYVFGFYEAVNQVRQVSPTGLKVLYPSSVFVESTPIDMGEYVTAKAAGETLCRYMSAAHKNLDIFVERLPKLATDQTASVVPAKNEDSVAVLQDILEKMA